MKRIKITKQLTKAITVIGYWLLVNVPAMAQQAGDIISGTVTDDFGPVMMANVVEIDAANRIVASAVTDMSGNFSFKLKNPKDKLRITYVGYRTPHCLPSLMIVLPGQQTLPSRQE